MSDEAAVGLALTVIAACLAFVIACILDEMGK